MVWTYKDEANFQLAQAVDSPNLSDSVSYRSVTF